MKTTNNSFLFGTYLFVFRTMLALMFVRFWWFYLPFAQHSTSAWLRPLTALYIVILGGITLILHRSHAARTLCRTGAYRYLAHPSYLLYTAGDIAIAVACESSHSFLNIASSLTFIARIVVTAYLEEQVLLVVYGLPARDHLKRTLSVHRAFDMV